MKLHYRFLWFVPSLICISAALWGSSDYSLFPRDDIYITPYCDSTDRDDGTILDSLVEKSGILRMGYSLGSGSLYPYAGVSFNGVNDTTWNLKHFTHISLRLKSPTLKKIRLVLTTKGTTIPVHYECSLPVDSQFNTYHIPISSLNVPSWWYMENRVQPEQIDHSQDLAKVTGLALENPDLGTVGVYYSFELEDIQFKQKRSWLFILSLIWAMAVATVFLIRKRKRYKPVPLYREITLPDGDEELFKRIVLYIGNEYTDPDLQLEQVCSAFGVTRKKLSSLFRQKTGGTFKKYLNGIRLREAHRLICENESQITQILYAVGFNSPSHFNRLFQEEFRVSPSDLRKAK